MPLYEYRCTACGHVFEKIESFSAPETTACVKCGSRSERLLSAPAIQFKGSGFYLTDYGKAGGSGKGSAGGEGKSDSSGSAPASSGSGESSKPAPPASSAPASEPARSSGANSGASASGSGSSPAKSS